MLRIVVDPEFREPTLAEMQYLLGEGDEPLEVSWQNTAAEIRLVEQVRDRDVTLVVPDVVAMRRAVWTLGGNLHFDDRLQTATSRTLLSTEELSPEWPEFTKSTGYEVTKDVLVHLVGEVITQGLNPARLRAVVDSCMFDDISIRDAKVLFNLSRRIGEEDAGNHS